MAKRILCGDQINPHQVISKIRKTMGIFVLLKIKPKIVIKNSVIQ